MSYLSQPRIVLKLFLFLSRFHPQFSYKIFLIKEKSISHLYNNNIIKWSFHKLHEKQHSTWRIEIRWYPRETWITTTELIDATSIRALLTRYPADLATNPFISNTYFYVLSLLFATCFDDITAWYFGQHVVQWIVGIKDLCHNDYLILKIIVEITPTIN